MLKKWGFYLFAFSLFVAGQFIASSRLVSGTPPPIEAVTLAGKPAMLLIAKGPGLIYFWGEWCGVCRAMQGNIDAIARDFPTLTVAISSGDNPALRAYLGDKNLNWDTVNDGDGSIGQRYGVRAVPAMLITNPRGEIVLSSSGYTSEWGLRLRLWLASYL